MAVCSKFSIPWKNEAIASRISNLFREPVLVMPKFLAESEKMINDNSVQVNNSVNVVDNDSY